MNIIHSTDVLESEIPKGIKYWQGMVGEENGEYFTLTKFWQVTKSGESKRQTSAPTRVKGKNIGKANETSDRDQAFSELKSILNKQIDKKGYHKHGEVSTALLKPMACLKFKEASHRLKGELCVQPKLDGTRQLYNGQIMWSRGGKEQLPDIYKHLHFDTKGYIVDGELILPSPFTFQQTLSATKKYYPDMSPKLQYHIFDIADEMGELTFKERNEIAKQIVADCGNPDILLVPTTILKNVNEVMQYQDEFVAMGYEGIIVRMMHGKYKPENVGRSHEIQKFKYFIDDEFEVVDLADGNGKNEGVAKFICKTKAGTLFNADYNGTMEERKEMFQHPELYIGKKLTVKFQKYTDDGVTPQFGKGIGFRDYDIQGGSAE